MKALTSFVKKWRSKLLHVVYLVLIDLLINIFFLLAMRLAMEAYIVTTNCV